MVELKVIVKPVEADLKALMGWEKEEPALLLKLELPRSFSVYWWSVPVKLFLKDVKTGKIREEWITLKLPEEPEEKVVEEYLKKLKDNLLARGLALVDFRIDWNRVVKQKMKLGERAVRMPPPVGQSVGTVGHPEPRTFRIILPASLLPKFILLLFAARGRIPPPESFAYKLTSRELEFTIDIPREVFEKFIQKVKKKREEYKSKIEILGREIDKIRRQIARLERILLEKESEVERLRRLYEINKREPLKEKLEKALQELGKLRGEVTPQIEELKRQLAEKLKELEEVRRLLKEEEVPEKEARREIVYDIARATVPEFILEQIVSNQPKLGMLTEMLSELATKLGIKSPEVAEAIAEKLYEKVRRGEIPLTTLEHARYLKLILARLKLAGARLTHPIMELHRIIEELEKKYSKKEETKTRELAYT